MAVTKADGKQSSEVDSGFFVHAGTAVPGVAHNSGNSLRSKLFSEANSESGLNHYCCVTEESTSFVGNTLKPLVTGSLEQSKGFFSDKSKVAQTNSGCKGTMGFDSSLTNKGMLLNDLPSCSLSLCELSSNDKGFCPTTEEVIAFGGIPKPTQQVRSSTRLGGQPNADVPQLERAMQNAQMRHDPFGSGQFSLPKHSIVNISDSEIVRRADRLGISLGQSEREIGKSVKGIKMLEEERILTILKKNESEIENKEEGLETLVLSKVSTLCEDLIDDDDTTLDFDDQLEHLKPVVKVKKIRQRKVYDTSNIRKSTRKRI
jgi:hypothetical protein